MGILIHPNGSLSHYLQGFIHPSKRWWEKFLAGFSGCQASSLFRPLGGSWSMIYEVPFGRRGLMVDDGLRFQTWKSMFEAV